MDSGSPGPRQRWCQRPGHGLARAPGPAGAVGELGAQRNRPGSPGGAFGSLQRGGGGRLPVVSKGEPWKGSAGYARLQEIGDVRLSCQRLRQLETS